MFLASKTFFRYFSSHSHFFRGSKLFTSFIESRCQWKQFFKRAAARHNADVYPHRRAPNDVRATLAFILSCVWSGIDLADGLSWPPATSSDELDWPQLRNRLLQISEVITSQIYPYFRAKTTIFEVNFWVCWQKLLKQHASRTTHHQTSHGFFDWRKLDQRHLAVFPIETKSKVVALSVRNICGKARKSSAFLKINLSRAERVNSTRTTPTTFPDHNELSCGQIFLLL